jgi:hypothetical protein
MRFMNISRVDNGERVIRIASFDGPVGAADAGPDGGRGPGSDGYAIETV